MFKLPRLNYKQMGILLAVLIISYFFRDICTRNIMLILPHLIMGIIIWFLVDKLHIRVMFIAFVIGYCIDGMNYISKGFKLKRMFDLPWGGAVLGITSIILGEHFDFKDLISLGTVLPMITIVIFLVTIYLEGMEEYISTAKHVTGAPLEQIVSVNSLLVLCLLFIIFAIILICDLMNVEEVLQGAGKAFLAILKIILIIAYAIFAFIMSFLFPNISRYSGGGRMAMDVAEEAGLITNILNFIIFSVFILFSVVAIYKLFRWLIAFLLTKNVRDNEISEEIHKEKKVEVTKEKIGYKESLIGNSPDLKARRIYKNKVRKYRFVFVPEKTSTAGDIKHLMQVSKTSYEKYFKTDNKEDDEEIKINNVNEITELYEKVRYGGIIPDKDYLNKMKELGKK
ncbi:MAG: hypothetical protein K6E10_04530 [Eubacterium sp.]|nr:hypothetical protein [Eubacterium sp.]